MWCAPASGRMRRRPCAELFRLARAHGNKTFVVYGDERVTYEEFARAALAIAEALQRAGYKGRPRRHRHAQSAGMAGRRSSAVGSRAAIVGVAQCLVDRPGACNTASDDFGAKVECDLADHERLKRIFEHLQNCPALERVFVCRAAEDLIAAPARSPSSKPSSARVGAWHLLPDPAAASTPAPRSIRRTTPPSFYTSGTTGKPKGALGTHRNATTRHWCAAFGPQCARSCAAAKPVPPLILPHRRKCSLLSVPFFHVTGCHAAMLRRARRRHQDSCSCASWDPCSARHALIERERITVAGGVPTHRLATPRASGARAHSTSPRWKNRPIGGAPASAELVRRINEVFPQGRARHRLGHDRDLRRFHRPQAEDYVARPAS